MKVDDITYKVRAAVFEVNHEMGSGFLEKVYENSMMVELRRQGLKAKAQVPLEVRYKGEVVGEYQADILVEDQVLVELKAVERLQSVHEAQILNYLKATGIRVGLLVNFRYPKAEIKRYVFDPKENPADF